MVMAGHVAGREGVVRRRRLRFRRPMAISKASRRHAGTAPPGRGPTAATRDRPAAATAAGRAFRASLLIGMLGLASALFVFVRLLESWRVTARSASHDVSILGQALSYPAANVGALVVIILGALGLVTTLVAVSGAVRELAGARRFQRRLARQQPRPLRGARVIDDARPQAFCAGLLRPRVYVSTGTLALLGDQELDVVLAHERHHALRRDPLRLATGRVLARALFFLPLLADLVRQQQALAELRADDAAVAGAPATRSALASAMLSFADVHAEGGETDVSAGVDPARVDHLLGEPLGWRFPLAIGLASLAIVALLIAVAVLAGQTASGSATLAPPFLSAQPCVVVLAMVPATVGAVAVRVLRGRRATQRGDRAQRG